MIGNYNLIIGVCSKRRSQEPWETITGTTSAQLRPERVSRRWADEEGGGEG